MQTINVLANPFFFLTAKGIAQGAICKPGTTDTYIGAHIDDVATAKADKTRFWFDGLPVALTFSGELARAIKDGLLFAADEPTARACGAEYVLPADALKAAREAAKAKWLDAYGSPVTIVLPTEPTKTDAELAVLAAAAAKAKTEAVAPVAEPAASPTSEPAAKAKR